MVNPTLTVSIDRTSLSLSPLLLSARLDGTTLGITEYTPPPLQRRNTYATDSPYTHGSELSASSWQQAFLGFNWMRVGATTEAQIRTSYNEVVAALSQFTYTVTTTENGAAAQVWACDPASMELAGSRRDLISMKYLVPVYAVTIPVYPIAGS